MQPSNKTISFTWKRDVQHLLKVSIWRVSKQMIDAFKLFLDDLANLLVVVRSRQVWERRCNALGFVVTGLCWFVACSTA